MIGWLFFVIAYSTVGLLAARRIYEEEMEKDEYSDEVCTTLGALGGFFFWPIILLAFGFWWWLSAGKRKRKRLKAEAKARELREIENNRILAQFDKDVGASLYHTPIDPEPAIVTTPDGRRYPIADYIALGRPGSDEKWTGFNIVSGYSRFEK